MVGPTTAQPTGTGFVRVANPGADRYFQELRGAYAGLRLYDPDFAIARDPWVYEKMLRDPLIRQCLSERLRAVAGGTWSILPARNPTDKDEEAARVIEQCVAELENNGFQMARCNLAKFVWEGMRHAVVYGRRGVKAYGDGKARDWWYPTRLRDLNKRRVRVWREGGNIVRKLERILDDSGITYEAVDFPSDRIITAIYDDEESRLGFGRGLGDSCYWFFFLCWKLLEEGVDAARTWAQGIMVGKYDAAAAGATDQDSESGRDAFVSALQGMKARGVVVVGVTDEIEHYDGTGQGAQQILAFWNALRDATRGLLTGAKLPSGGGSDETGSLARAEVEQETSEGVYQLDSAILDDAITRGLIKPIWDRNVENLADMGLADARMPSFHSASEKTENRQENATIVASMLGAGFDLKRDEAYAKVGLTVPTEEDEAAGNVIKGAAPMPAGGDPFGGGGGNGREPRPAPKDGGEYDAYVPDAYAYSLRCGCAKFASDDPDDWVSRMVADAAKSIRDLMRARIALDRGVEGASALHAEALAKVRDHIAEAMTAGDIEGREEILQALRRVEGGDAAAEAAMTTDHAAAGTVPRVPFGEAVEDVLRREPLLRQTAEEVAKAYRDGPAFALAKSVDLGVTREVQRIVTAHIKDGGTSQLTIEAIARQSKDFSEAYAETVLRTNAATANTQGRFAQVKNPNVRRVIPAFEYRAVGDRDTRRGRDEDHGENHLAAHGLIAPVDDPVWMRCAPPNGYRCRCRVILKTKYQLERLGLMKDDGTVQRRIPPSFASFRRHPNFVRSRMPGS